MFSMLYFPVVSALTSVHSDASKQARPQLELVLRGELGAALRQSSERLDKMGTSERMSCELQLHADLQLVLGFEAEAEENYRRSQRKIQGAKWRIRIATCRNTAWQALFRHRVSTALACFSRASDEPDIQAGGLAEARFGIACALYEMGRMDEAFDVLDSMERLVEQEFGDTRVYWRDLIAALRFDFVVQSELRCATALSDHVYWQSALSSSLMARMRGAPAPAMSVTTPLLCDRASYLLQLRRTAHGDRDAVSSLARYLDVAREHGFVDLQWTLRLEIAIALLAGDAPYLAHSMLEPISEVVHGGESSRKHLEYFYCAAKTRQALGRAQESLQLYSRYALVAMRCLREDSLMRKPFLSREMKQPRQPDDVAARLPLKYRRAYQYVLQNLDRSDLSVREIAAEIGVTERALQNAFKIFLGLSPRELIRSKRMERIRAELVDSTLTGERSIKETARKWGVQNGSTLVIGYRKEFDETPSETLER
ncbi:helix-turn-helix transcriptional regulator [Burkholderia oklahomensis]|uniref:helix-turn-helix transcriptional regulator n=1 Tax=Burkholderia oklahomensis TaxID=342113 RepID=UPI0004732626|nr:helix-turn-helix transcriptional regulator [Burkholderia oklahomensis]AJX35480.1 helix-turn-helix domain protein [Burkholderia oklahomensis C6786]AOI49271.1 AraC family transcriptional regulator [Burkholderia oklahomensis C6786]KUY60681.1 AraC family transcriptional regulator [Burkholderia oklahomensis C6786]MBI0362486.1 helix-turn-helix transcriptional regulator [Burkholderia oklahomensis]SUY26593.1 transcriptional regulator EutR [Burkholderia oklahomensis]